MKKQLQLTLFNLIIFVSLYSQIPTIGLVGYYPFSGNANDLSATANHGIINGATLTSDRFGNANNAYTFNGSSCIIAPNNSAQNPSSMISISAWVQTTNSHTNAGIVGKWNILGGISGGTEQYLLWANSNGVNFSLNTSNYYLITENNVNYNNGNWHHYCGVWEGSTYKLYRDAILVSTASHSGVIPVFNQNLEIGRYAGGIQPYLYFNGKIDDVRIYNRGLTGTEVTSLFNESNPSLPVNPITGSVISWSRITQTTPNFSAALQASAAFGAELSALGDIDNDGNPDFAVTAPYYSTSGYSNVGAVYVVRMNANGGVKAVTTISLNQGNFGTGIGSSSYFGMDVNGIGDFNSDGIEDMIVGDNNDNVFIIRLDTNGTVKQKSVFVNPTGTGSYSYFGNSLDTLGDINNDGVKDFIVSAYGEGKVYFIRMNADGSIKNYTSISQTAVGSSGEWFGFNVANIGDINGNNSNDIVVGAYTANSQKGAIYVLKMDTSYSQVVSYSKIGNGIGGFPPVLNNGDIFGARIGSIGDLDGDGISDFIVGAVQDNDGGNFGTNYGAGYFISIDSSGIVKSYYKIGKSSANFNTALTAGDSFGRGFSILGDIDNDGNKEILVGSTGDDNGGTNKGAVYLLELKSNFEVTTTSNNPLCFGQCTGGINLAPLGGTGTISYLWNTGQTTASRTNLCAGTYTCTISDQANHTIIKSITLTQPAKVSVTASNDTAMCSGNCTTISASGSGGVAPYFYMWNQGLNLGQTKTVCPQNTTSYIVTLVDGNNCSSDPDTVIVTAIPLPVATIAGLSVTYCSNDQIDTIQGMPAGGIFTGNGINGNLFNPSVGGSGSRYITYTAGVSGCSDTAMQLVTVNLAPVVSINGLSSSFCKNDAAINLNGTPSGGSFTGSGIIGNQFNPNLVNPGYYILTYLYTNANNCIAQDTQWIKVNTNPVAFAGSNQVITPGTGITLMGNAGSGSGAYSYFWTPSDSFYYPAVQNATTKPLFSNNNFILTVTDLSNSCSGKDTVTVLTQVSPIVSTIGASPSSICLGQNSQLSNTTTGGIGAYNFSWTSIPAGFNSTAQNPQVSPTLTTKYILHVSDGYSADNDTVEVIVKPLPNVNLGNDTLLCNTQNYTLIAGPATGNSYLWSTGSIGNSIQIPTFTFSDGVYKYTVTVTSSGNCIAKDSISLTVSKIPNIYLGSDTLICKTQNLLLNAGTGFSSYLWQNGSTSQTLLVDSMMGIGPQLIHVMAYNGFGCVERDTIVVNINVCIGIENTSMDEKIRIYPNPTQDKLFIETELACFIELLDQTGRIIKSASKTNETNSMKIDLNSYSNGIYYLKIIYHDKEYIKKVVKN